MKTKRPVFPFTALVGQRDMQRGLIIAAVDPMVGGVLILGDRGTGKSTAVRALAAVLPPIRAVSGCAYRCAPQATAGLCERCAPGKSPRPAAADIAVPVVDLPLGATEDRILGALDLERLMVAGEKRRVWIPEELERHIWMTCTAGVAAGVGIAGSGRFRTRWLCCKPASTQDGQQRKN